MSESTVVKTPVLLDPILLRAQLPANINLIVGNPAAAGWDALKKQFKIMGGEWNELVKNFNEGNYFGLVDDVQDLLFTLIGFSHTAGFMHEFAENYQRVVASQIRKFDLTLEDAAITAAKYTNKGVQVITETVMTDDTIYYVTKSACEQIEPGRNEVIPAGKWLKSHRFVEPTLLMPSADIQLKFALVTESEEVVVSLTAPTVLGLDLFDIISDPSGATTERTALHIELDANDPTPEDTIQKILQDHPTV